MIPPRDAPSAAVSRALTAGVCVSLSLMTLGAALSAASGRPLPASTPPPALLPAALGRGEPAALVALGVLALIATPAARVVVLAWQFARRREWAMTAVSLAVLGILTCGVVLGREG